MSQKQRVIIVAVVVFIAGVIFFFPQLQSLLGLRSSKGEIEANILVALEQAEKEKRPIFLDFYGGY